MLASARFRAALPYSHRIYEYADVVTPGGETIQLRITQGSVTVDRSAQYRRSCTMVCFDPTGTLTPSNAESVVSPFGSRILPYQGILYQDGTSEVYPLGDFYISNVTVTQANPANNQGTSIAITAYDKSRRISRNKFLSTYSIAQGTKVVNAITTLVSMTFPDAQFDSITHGMTLPYPLTYAVGDDPWKAITDLAVSIGCVVYFDANGKCVIAPPTDVNAPGSPVWTYIEGPGCTMTDVDVVYDDGALYNGVTVVGATPANSASGTPPVQATVWDMDPTSPTYRYGPYGQVPMVVNDTTITTVADAQASAASLLNGQLGLTTQTNVQTWAANTALEVDDVVQVERASVKATGLYIVDAMTIPMGSAVTGTPASAIYGSVTLRQKRGQ